QERSYSRLILLLRLGDGLKRIQLGETLQQGADRGHEIRPGLASAGQAAPVWVALAHRGHRSGRGDEHIAGTVEEVLLSCCQLRPCHAGTCCSRCCSTACCAHRRATAQIVAVGLRPDEVTKVLPSTT